MIIYSLETIKYTLSTMLNYLQYKPSIHWFLLLFQLKVCLMFRFIFKLHSNSLTNKLFTQGEYMESLIYLEKLEAFHPFLLSSFNFHLITWLNFYFIFIQFKNYFSLKPTNKNSLKIIKQKMSRKNKLLRLNLFWFRK
jgi:hypothetical protein